jgi:hypothetical protein
MLSFNKINLNIRMKSLWHRLLWFAPGKTSVALETKNQFTNTHTIYSFFYSDKQTNVAMQPITIKRHFLFTIVLLLLSLPMLYAQANDSIEVIRFENITSACDSLKRGDYIKLTVNHLNTFVKNKPENSKIILYIDRIPFDDLEPDFIDTLTHQIIFKFEKKSESKAWAYFYKKPREWILDKRSISIGYHNQYAVKTKAAVRLIIIQQFWYYIGLLMIAAITIIFISLAITTNLLRDSASIYQKTRPYSLSRTQFTFWLLLIVSAYIFLWISTGDMPILTNSSLILLGISGSTSIISKVIDNSQLFRERHQDQNTKGFLIDILSDEDGISIHRLQMFIFTLALGFIFLHDVVVVFEMPDFDSNLLILMGISSGTYTGFKTAENSRTITVG